MSLALLFHYLMLNMFRMLIHPSSAAFDLCAELFHGLYCSNSMCVGVTLWFGYGGVVWYPYAGFSLHTDSCTVYVMYTTVYVLYMQCILLYMYCICNVYYCICTVYAMYTTVYVLYM